MVTIDKEELKKENPFVHNILEDKLNADFEYAESLFDEKDFGTFESVLENINKIESFLKLELSTRKDFEEGA